MVYKLAYIHVCNGMFVRDVSLSARRDNNTYIKDLDQSDSDSAGSA